MKTKALNNLSRSFKRFGLQCKKHSPSIMVGAGVVGVVAGAVMACKATIKVQPVLEEQKQKIVDIREQMKEQEKGDNRGTKELTLAYGQTAFKVAKLYAPAVAVGTLSIASIVGAHHVMKKRNAAISAAYLAVDQGFKAYRKNVKDRFGETVDRELKYNLTPAEIKTIEIDENGQEVESTKKVNVSLEQNSPYAVFFDELSPYYQKDAELNKFFLLQQERNANQKLQVDGYLFLNDVYESLGIPKTKAGQLVGWVYDKNNPVGDNYVDFGIFDTHRPYPESRRAFVNGYEKAILLDFNVDGEVYELLP